GIGERHALVIRRGLDALAQQLRRLAIALLRGAGEHLEILGRKRRGDVAVTEELAVARHRLGAAPGGGDAARRAQRLGILVEQARQLGRARRAAILRGDAARVLEITLRGGGLVAERGRLDRAGQGVAVVRLHRQQALIGLERALRLALLLPALRLLGEV